MSHRYAFTTKGVLRQLSWDLFREYCGASRFFLDSDVLRQDEPDLEALIEAVQELPADRRTDLEQDLQDVYELADDDGHRIIFEEAKARGEDLTAILTQLDSAYDAALWLLVNRSSLFADLVRLHSADSLNRRYWRRRYVGRGFQAETDRNTIDRLSRHLTAYFLREEGRGLHCFVEHLARATGDLFIAYPEDFGSTVYEYQGDELVKRKIRPATDLLFFFSSETGMLDVFCHGTKRKVKDLQQLFGLTVLGAALADESVSGGTYDLNIMKNDGFSFLIDPTTGLEAIEVKWIRVRDRDGGRSVTVEVGGPPGRGILYAASRYWSVTPGEATDKYPFHLMDIERAKLQAAFRPIGKSRRGRTKTFTIAENGCLLDHEGIDGILRKVLADSRLERPVAEPLGV